MTPKGHFIAQYTGSKGLDLDRPRISGSVKVYFLEVYSNNMSQIIIFWQTIAL